MTLQEVSIDGDGVVALGQRAVVRIECSLVDAFQRAVEHEVQVRRQVKEFLACPLRPGEELMHEGSMRGIQALQPKRGVGEVRLGLRHRSNGGNRRLCLHGLFSSRPCKIHRNIQPSDPQRVLRACVAIASAAAQIHSRASRGAKSPLRPKRTIARSSQRML